MNIPASFKPLVSFIKRAEELDKDTRGESALVAYYCRTYAMEQGIKLSKQDKSTEGQQFLLELMTRLEQDKKKCSAFTEEEGKMVCLNFADSVFRKADEEDRAGLADKGTARTFHAAGVFYDILQQFGELDSDVVQKKKYCKWKAAAILKAIKNGTPIQPGGFGEDAVDPFAALMPSADELPNDKTDRREEANQPFDIPSAPYNAPSVPLAPKPSSPPYSPAPTFTPASAPAPAPAHVVTPAAASRSASGVQPMYPSSPSAPSGPVPGAAAAYSRPAAAVIAAPSPARRGSKRVDPLAIEDAIELTRFALAALQAKETDLAKQRLQEALSLLG